MSKISRLRGLFDKDTRRIIGLMSGMSMDGIDLAFVRIRGRFPDLDVKLLDTHYAPYETGLKNRLLKARQTASALDACLLDAEVAGAFSGCVLDFLETKNISAEDVDAIGSHGQTLVHVPPSGERNGSTMQLGSASVIAELTGIPVVSSFRMRDMAAGGQGAPLIALVDYILYSQQETTTAVNNLGSISNVTIVTPDVDDVTAFDTGPANMIVDHFARKISSDCNGMDKSGKLSSTGKVNRDLLEDMLALEFFSKRPPKSAGYEDFGPWIMEEAARKYPDTGPGDLLRTAVELSVETMARAYEDYVFPAFADLDKIILTGGGCYNRTLVEGIRRRLPDIDIRQLSDTDPALNDAKEALGFAVLANETLSGRAGNVPGATGASRYVILGEISP